MSSPHCYKITYIKGQLEEIEPEQIVIDNGGIGYRIMVPASMIQRLPSIGETVKIHTYMHVREDAMQLFGFLTKADLSMFKLLITVNGIGPRGALGVLSVLSANDLKFAILAGDIKTICSAPGIGKKTAEKTVLELKDKIKLEDAFEEKLQETEQMEENGELQNVRQDATEALVALGYSQTEALKAVRGIDVTPDMDAEQLLKLSLKKLL